MHRSAISMEELINYFTEGKINQIFLRVLDNLMVLKV